MPKGLIFLHFWVHAPHLPIAELLAAWSDMLSHRAWHTTLVHSKLPSTSTCAPTPCFKCKIHLFCFAAKGLTVLSVSAAVNLLESQQEPKSAFGRRSDRARR